MNKENEQNRKQWKYEIWLGNDYGFFTEGVAHSDDGRKLPLNACVHSATYVNDSVQINDEEHFTLGRFPLRWFVKEGALDFYSVASDTPSII